MTITLIPPLPHSTPQNTNKCLYQYHHYHHPLQPSIIHLHRLTIRITHTVTHTGSIRTSTGIVMQVIMKLGILGRPASSLGVCGGQASLARTQVRKLVRIVKTGRTQRQLITTATTSSRSCIGTVKITPVSASTVLFHLWSVTHPIQGVVLELLQTRPLVPHRLQRGLVAGGEGLVGCVFIFIILFVFLSGDELLRLCIEGSVYSV